MTRSLDELIKGRIAEGQFDDVVRLVAPPPEVKKATIELDDSKPQQGLGELYEADYVRAVSGAADDKVGGVRWGDLGWRASHGVGWGGLMVKPQCGWGWSQDVRKKFVGHTWTAAAASQLADRAGASVPLPTMQDEEVRQSARAQFSALCAKLDALSHLHFT